MLSWAYSEAVMPPGTRSRSTFTFTAKPSSASPFTSESNRTPLTSRASSAAWLSEASPHPSGTEYVYPVPSTLSSSSPPQPAAAKAARARRTAPLRRIAMALEEVADLARKPGPLPRKRRFSPVLDHELAPREPAIVFLRDSERVQGVRLVAGAHDQHGNVQVGERLEALPGDRARHLSQRGRHGRRVVVALHALAGRLPGDLAPALGQAVGLGHVHEGVDAAALELRGHPLPGVPIHVAGAGVAGVGRRDLHQRRHTLRVLQSEGHGRGGPHRAAHEGRALDPEMVEDGLEVVHELGVLVAPAGGGGPVAARVVGDQAVAPLDEVARALHDVAPRGRQPVQKDDRGAVTRLLATEDDPRYEPVRGPEPEVEPEDRYRDRPNVRRLQRRRRDEIDDIFADEPRGSGRETRVLRPVGGNRRSTAGGDIQDHLVIPKSFNDAQQIADQFKDAIPVILNLQGTDTDLSKRLIDFASGLTYALDGGMQRIADKVFLLTPRNVEVSAEERARLIEKGFFNQS